MTHCSELKESKEAALVRCCGISEEGEVHSSLGFHEDFLQEVAFELEQDWPSVENIELYEQWRNPMRQVVQFFFKCYSFANELITCIGTSLVVR